MVRRNAVLFYCLTVFDCGVALVREPVILRILSSEGIHKIITISLGKDACRCYGEVFAIALHYRGMRQGVAVIKQGHVLIAVNGAMIDGRIIGVETVAIYYQCLWLHLQLVYRPVHSEVGCMENVYLVYLLRRTDAHSPRYGITLYFFTQLISSLLRQLLGVVQHFVMIIVRQDYGCCKHRTSKASPTRLVAASLNLPSIIMW